MKRYKAVRKLLMIVIVAAVMVSSTGQIKAVEEDETTEVNLFVDRSVTENQWCEVGKCILSCECKCEKAIGTGDCTCILLKPNTKDQTESNTSIGFGNYESIEQKGITTSTGSGSGSGSEVTDKAEDTDEVIDQTDIETSDTPHFNVTIPTKTVISVDSENNVTTSKGVTIINNSNKSIIVESIEVIGKNGWKLVKDGQITDKVNHKEVYLQVNLGDGIIGSNSQKTFGYTAKISPQTQSITEESIADIVFTVTWEG